MMEFADWLFDTAGTVFAAGGAALMLLGLGLAAWLGRFHSRAGEVRARVVAHENQRVTVVDRDSGEERQVYQPVFELVDGADAGKRHRSSEVQMRNAYPVGTVWPAKYDPVSGAIRTDRALVAWPFLCAGFVVIGLAFMVIPNMPLLDGETALPFAFVALGLAAMVAGVWVLLSRRRSGPRSLDVTARLVAIEVHKDTERHDYDVPVLRIMAGPYEGVETVDVSIADVCHGDIGQVMPARFDPHSGRIAVTEGKFRSGSMVVPLLATGAVFALIGLAIGGGLF